MGDYCTVLSHKFILWFLSMVGAQTALKAIWASLLKQPPDVAHLIRGADGMPLSGGYQRCSVPYATIGTWTAKIARLPASPQDVTAYLEDRSKTGARPSTLRAAAAAIARNHKNVGFDVPVQHSPTHTVLDELTLDNTPGLIRALPLDLDCYPAIRETAQEPRPERGGRLEHAASARNRGAVDITMIGLMRDAILRVSEAAALIWGTSGAYAAAPASSVSVEQMRRNTVK